MSKNERVVRTLLAGLVFAAIGVVASVDFAGAPDPMALSRSPAAQECKTQACLNLIRLRTELLSESGVDSTSDSLTQVEIQLREAKLLRQAGGVIASMFRIRDVAEVGDIELAEITSFLVETYSRDAEGTALDPVKRAVGPKKARTVLTALDATLDRLCAEGRFAKEPCEAFKSALAANLAEGEPETPPAPSKRN